MEIIINYNEHTKLKLQRYKYKRFNMGKFIYSDDEDLYEPQAPEQKKIFKSIDKYVNLPPAIPVTSKQLLFNRVDFSTPKPMIKPENTQAFKNVYQQLYNSFSIYENPEDYKFKFPDSMFEEQLDQDNKISYEPHLERQQIATFRSKMTEQQLIEIKQKGQFKTYSEDPEAPPYVWRINPIIFAGQQVRIKRLYNNLGVLYYMIVVTGKEVSTSILKCVLNVIKFPLNLLYTLIGKKQMKYQIKVDYEKQILKDFCLSVSDKMRNNQNFSFWQYLNTFYSYEVQSKSNSQQIAVLRRKVQDSKAILAQKQRKLYEIDNDIQRQWNKKKRKEMQKIQQMIEQNKIPTDEADTYFKQKLKQTKFCIYLEKVQQKVKQEGIDLQKINSLLFILRLFHLISCRTAKMNEQINTIRNNIKSQLQKKHPIRLNDKGLLYKQTDKQMKSIIEEKKKQFREKLFEDNTIKNLVTEVQYEIYQQYNQFIKEKPNKIKKKQEQLPSIQIGALQFYITESLMPPYKRKQTITNNEKYISLEINKTKKIRSDHNGYILNVYIQRFITYLKNYTKNIYWFMTRSIFGTKCLFAKEDFLWNERYKGKNIKEVKVRPIYKRFKQLYGKVMQNRNKFEEAPDRGIFGKKGSRIFNLIQCYFIKLFIGGIVGFIILGSLLIFLNLAICLILIIVGPFLIFSIQAITYTFEMLIFDDRSYSPVLKLVFTNIFLELLAIAGLFIFLVILLPVGIIIYSLFTVLQLIITVIADTFFYFLISKFGRTPSSNSSIAWKISGPGVSQSKYLSLNADDICVLTQSQLQRAFLSQIKKRTKQQIQKYYQQFNMTISLLISPYTNGTPNNTNNEVYINSCLLTKNFDKQYLQFGKRYPPRPKNVRFTEQEINNYFQKSKAIVKNFIEKNQHEQWIFDKFIVQNGDYDDLTKAIWILIFGCGESILQPLQKMDARVKIGQNRRFKMQKNIQQVMKSLEKQVSFSSISYNNNHSHKKRNITYRENQIQFGTLITMNQQNQQINIHLLEEYTYYLFHPRYHLEQLIKIDKINYQQAVNKNQS